jgi:hypothetical protein
MVKRPGMPRQLRVEFAGAWYHVMTRGDRREAIFVDDEDRGRFLQTVGEICERTGWQVLAWVLVFVTGAINRGMECMCQTGNL